LRRRERHSLYRLPSHLYQHFVTLCYFLLHFVADILSFPFLLSNAVLLQPLDVLKTRLQQYSGGSAASPILPKPSVGVVPKPSVGVVPKPSVSVVGASHTPCTTPASRAPASRALSELRVWSALGAIYRNEGFLSLWRGVAPSLARVGLGSGMYFLSLNELQQIAALHRVSGGPQAHLHNFAIGAAARVVASTVVAPITVLKTRLEAADSVRRSGLEITRQMLQQQPFRSSFKGLVPTLWRDAPYSGLYVTLYTQCRGSLPDLVPSFVPSPAINFTSGAFAGLLATMATQVQRCRRISRQNSSRSSSLFCEAFSCFFLLPWSFTTRLPFAAI
jgi:hypothetical protein